MFETRDLTICRLVIETRLLARMFLVFIGNVLEKIMNF